MRVLDLFAGIGGFSLAAHWMGWETAAFVEWEKFQQQVLAKNFPGVPIYGDIKQFHYEQERDRIGPIDIVCGGFPCQPFSTAGKRAGRDDDRHLWPEMLRVIRETQPAFVVGENVAGLVSMDGGDLLEEILTDLEGEGYAVQPFIVPAISVGAPHRRDRVWIVAQNTICGGLRFGADETGDGRKEQREPKPADEVRSGCVCGSPNSAIQRLSQPGQTGERQLSTKGRTGIHDRPEQPDSGAITNPERPRMEGQSQYEQGGHQPGRNETQPNGYGEPCSWSNHWYEAATRFCRMDDGLPRGVDIVGARDNRAKRLKALGNAIVPQVAYQLFKGIEEVFLCE